MTITYNQSLQSFCTHTLMAQWWLSTIWSLFCYEFIKTGLVNTYCFDYIMTANGVEWSECISQIQLCSATLYKILYEVIKNPTNAHHTSKG